MLQYDRKRSLETTLKYTKLSKTNNWNQGFFWERTLFQEERKEHKFFLSNQI